MVISDVHRFVYIDIPKTGSCTIDKILTTSFGGKAVGNLPGENTGFKHRRKIPGYASSYDIIASVRNPYDRALSLYFFMKSRQNPLARSFDDLLDYLLVNLTSNNPKYNHFPMWKYLEPIGEPTYIIKTENIGEGIAQLPFKADNISIPHLQKSPHDEDVMLSEDRLSKIHKWAGKDFEMFGYDRI